MDWDPSKWIITILHKLGLATGLKRARTEDITAAKSWIQSHHHEPFPTSASEGDSDNDSAELPRWTTEELMKNARQRGCLLVIEDYVVDVSIYLGEHVSCSSPIGPVAYI